MFDPILNPLRDEARWFRHNLAHNDLRTAVSTLVFNCRWRLGYWIGPFHHACDTADCSACLTDDA